MTFAPEPLFCSTVATWFADVAAPVRALSSFRSTRFAPETLVCVIEQLCCTPDVALTSLQLATLLPVVDDWTITHVFGAVVPLPAGEHENVLPPGPVASCRTRCAVVHSQPAPGQLGPA